MKILGLLAHIQVQTTPTTLDQLYLTISHFVANFCRYLLHIFCFL